MSLPIGCKQLALRVANAAATAWAEIRNVIGFMGVS